MLKPMFRKIEEVIKREQYADRFTFYENDFPRYNYGEQLENGISFVINTNVKNSQLFVVAKLQINRSGIDDLDVLNKIANEILYISYLVKFINNENINIKF